MKTKPNYLIQRIQSACLTVLLLLVGMSCFSQSSPLDSVTFYLRKVENLETDSSSVKKAFDFCVKNTFNKQEREIVYDYLYDLNSIIGRDIELAFKLAFCIKSKKSFEVEEVLAEFDLINSALKSPQTDFEKYLLLCSLQEMRLPYRNSHKIYDGISYYLELVNYFEEEGFNEAASLCYYVLGGFYNTLFLTEKSEYYRSKSANLLDANSIYNHDFWLYIASPSVGLIGSINRSAVAGSIYLDKELPQKAIPQLQKAKHIYESCDEAVLVRDAPFIYLQLFRAYIGIDNDSAAYYLGRTKQEIEKSIYNKEIYTVGRLLVESTFLIESEKYDSALVVLNEVIRLQNEYNIATNAFVGKIIPKYYKAIAYFSLGNYNKAIKALNEEIATLISVNLRRECLKEYELLARVYTKANQFEKASEIWEKIYNLSSDIEQESKNSRNLSFEVEQAIEEKNIRLKELDSKIDFYKKVRLYLLILTILSAVVALGLWNRFLSKRRTNKILREKNEIIEIEKRKNDELLFNILPEVIADELKETGHVESRKYEQVSVLFADIVGFTKISEQLNAAELVNEIDFYFCEFDRIMDNYEVEKIKTIGDCYMCALGLDEKAIVPHENIVFAAKEMRDFIVNERNKRKLHNRVHFEFRIGIHTGPVVAGVVGSKKYAYDIWGDTVNVAARIESSGESGKINVSETTYSILKENFEFTYRGKVEAKNKGSIDMYFVNI